MTALVLALTGTDHHPFTRLVQWIDAAAARHPDAHFVLQYGAAVPPEVAEGHAFLSHDRLVELIADASVVVCHAGPGTITDAREAGHVPLCVPRDPHLGEHVDGHQQRFATLVGGAGVVRDVRSLPSFERELGVALLQTRCLGSDLPASQLRDAARAQAAAELDALMTAPRPHLGPRLLGRRHAHDAVRPESDAAHR